MLNGENKVVNENELKKINNVSTSNIEENLLRKTMPAILDILLVDRTTTTLRKSSNIIWANENYIQYGHKDYAAEAQIKPELITKNYGHLIMPRILKSSEAQKERTKSKAEVFTPRWVVKKQNDEIDKNYENDSLENYIDRTWLEITCGEGPYMVTRYDMDDGEIVPFKHREGFVDRKLQRISKEVEDRTEWQRLVEKAYKASYGFEWNGDSLLLARENLLYTYRDYYYSKWGEEPFYEWFENIAKIISYNVFQMDGLRYVIPLSIKKEKVVSQQLSLFDQNDMEDRWILKKGIRVKIMNWEKNKMEFFDKEVIRYGKQ